MTATTTVRIKGRARWAAKGTTTDITTCEFCGREKLRKTVILVPLDEDGNPDGEVTHAGTSCAAVHLAVSTSAVTTAARVADHRRAQAVTEYAELGKSMEAAAERNDMRTWHVLAVARGQVWGLAYN